MRRTLIHNAHIINEGKQYNGFIVIEDSIIAAVCEGAPTAELFTICNTVYDAEGKWLIPGVIDDQVHFRDPGLTHKGDIASESAAAVAGGVTSFMDMPNTMPQTTTALALENKYSHAKEVSHANYSFYIGGTNDNIDTLLSTDFTKTCGVKLFLGSSTGNMLVNNEEALRRIFSEVPALICIHAEEEAIIQANKKYYTETFGNDLPIFFHPMIRSAEACYESSAKAAALAAKYNTRLHILHLSTEKELSLLSDAPLKDKRITGEVCVHHLWFTDNDYAKYGNRIKWNPAIKTTADRNALREALRCGKLDIVATDHAPHLVSEKQGNCLKAASGGPLIQHSLLLMLEMARQGVFSPELVIDKMCHAPATLYSVECRGYIRTGYYADLVIIDPNKSFTVATDNILYKCKWSPFEGTTLSHTISRTYVNGEIAYDNGNVLDTRGMRMTFKR